MKGLAVIMLAAGMAGGYPFDAFPQTGIRRLERVRLIVEKKIAAPMPPAGALLAGNAIALSLTGRSSIDSAVLTTADAGLQAKLSVLFSKKDPNYSCALLDITAGRPARFAAWKQEKAGVPGSVGKLAIAAGLFAELRRLYPADTDKRRELLRTRMVRAGQWVVPNHHQVPVFDPQTRAFANRAVKTDDVFSLYEWADHMLSASSNAAASVVWKELILMRAFGKQYPPSEKDEADYFVKTAKDELGKIGYSVVNDPLRDLGIGKEQWQLGSFFTAAGKRFVPVGGGSRATPYALMLYLVGLEEGRIVDEWSSLEIKKLMYMTAKRIRYASSPALAGAAVYFKSGSQYKCKKEEGFTCTKYHGNVENHMNSVAIVEHADGTKYLVVLMSNVLRKNSAYEHQIIATEIDRIVRSR